MAVEVAGGLVGEQYRWVRGKGAGDGHPLLLATGQLARRVAQAFAQANPFEQGAGLFAGVAAAVELQRQHDVFQCVEAVEQLERLEHEADMFGAHACPLVLVQRAQVVAREDYFAGTGPVESGQQPEQGRFARARGADDGQAVTLGKVK
ncbi:hypothetical protein D3C76_769330 [compost metagenome]